MSRRTVLTWLVAAAAIACSDPTGGELAGGASGSGEERDDERRDGAGVIDGLFDPGDDDGDAQSDAGEPVDGGAMDEPDAAPNDASTTDGSIDGDSGAEAGDDNDDAAEPGCPDEDGDGICDADDDCPLGHATFCDGVIWRIEMPRDSYPVAENAGDRWFWAFNFTTHDDAHMVGLDMQPDGLTHSYYLDDAKLDEVRAFFAEHDAISATIGFMTSSQVPIGQPSGPPVIASVQVECPFVASDAVIRRVGVTGQMSRLGIGFVSIEVRGYVASSM